MPDPRDESPPSYQRWFAELKRRKVFRVIAVYGAASFVVLQAADVIFPAIPLPEWTISLVLYLLLLGFPIAVALAWVFEVTPDGVRRTVAAAPEDIDAIVAAPARVRWPAGLLALGGIVLLGLSFYLGRRSAPDLARSAGDSAAAATAIAILPAYSPGDAASVGAGMNALLSAGVDGVAGWRAVSSRTVQARWDERVAGAVADEATALDVGRATGAAYAVLPTVVVLPTELQISAEVFDLSDDTHVGTVEAAGAADSLGAVAERLAVRIINQVLRGEGEVTLDLAQVTSGSTDALRAFLEGEVHLRNYELVAARDALLEAVTVDSAFALAHYRLAEVYQWGETWDPGASGRHMRLAARHADRLNPKEAGVVRARTTTAPVGSPSRERARMLRDVAAAHPDDPTVLYWLGETLIHSTGPLARASEIDSVFQSAVRLDPTNPTLYPHTLGFTFSFRRDSALAYEQSTRFASLAGSMTGPLMGDLDPRGAVAAWELAFGDPETRRRAEAWVLESERPRDRALAVLGFIPTPQFDSQVEWLLGILMDEQHPELERVPAPFESSVQAATNLGFFRNLVWKGRIGEALPALPLVPETNGTGLAVFLSAHLAGIPLPDSALAAEFGSQWISPDMTAWRGVGVVVWAEEEGRREDVERALEILETSFVDTSDPPRWWLGLEGILAWKRGDVDRAERLLDQSYSTGFWLHWVYVRMLLEQERWGEVEPLLATGGQEAEFFPFVDQPMARYYLGSVYEQLGEPRKAAAAYGYFLEHWSDADLAAQPMVDHARRRLETLIRETG